MNLQESIRRILKEETEDGMKDIMFDIFDENTKGSEIYKYNDSLWMILPEQKEWVFEIDVDLTLYYNYYFFEKIYKYVSLDVIDNQHYITEWVEDIIKTGARHTYGDEQTQQSPVEDIIKTGVRHTYWTPVLWLSAVEDIIKTGVRHTNREQHLGRGYVEDIIKTGKKG